MALWVCGSCTAAYSPEAPRCPECGSTDYTDQGVLEMAKITAANGPTYTDAEVEANPELVPNPPAEGEDSGAVEATDPDDVFDPGDYNVTDVNAYLDLCRDEDNQAEYDRVLTAEQAGKNRAGIVNR